MDTEILIGEHLEKQNLCVYEHSCSVHMRVHICMLTSGFKTIPSPNPQFGPFVLLWQSRLKKTD